MNHGVTIVAMAAAWAVGVFAVMRGVALALGKSLERGPTAEAADEPAQRPRADARPAHR